MKNKKERIFRRKVSLKTKASTLFYILLFAAIVIASVVSMIVATVATASVVLSFIPNVIFSYLVGIAAGIIFGILIFNFLAFVIVLILEIVGKWRCVYCFTRHRIFCGNYCFSFFRFKFVVLCAAYDIRDRISMLFYCRNIPYTLVSCCIRKVFRMGDY